MREEKGKMKMEAQTTEGREKRKKKRQLSSICGRGRTKVKMSRSTEMSGLNLMKMSRFF